LRSCRSWAYGTTTEARQTFFDDFKQCIEQEYLTSTEIALEVETAQYDLDEGWQGINIMTDARHGWRKNAKDSSIVTIGEKSNKVLHHAHVTKADDHVTQRHEKLGTEWVYSYLESKDTPVAVHIHDRNMSINKLVRDKKGPVNQNDTWHGVKSLKKVLLTISSGPKYKKGITWHPELEDKVEPVCTHAHFAIRNCNGDPEQLRAMLLNVPEHYKGNHTNCHHTSRCKTDPHYEPSRIVITDQKAESLLRNAITGSLIYKNPQDFILGKDSSIVESFNNSMNIFHDKRIAFSDAQYLSRSHLAVCHWNENVGRGHTSVWKPKHDPKAPRSQKGKKNYVKCTYKYREQMWNGHIHSLFGQK